MGDGLARWEIGSRKTKLTIILRGYSRVLGRIEEGGRERKKKSAVEWRAQPFEKRQPAKERDCELLRNNLN
jgi:hypothetical protein